jgi:hypothetical protein
MAAEALASTSAYWLRHMAGSHMSDRQVLHAPRAYNFGHASIATISIYLHGNEAKQARQIRAAFTA